MNEPVDPIEAITRQLELLMLGYGFNFYRAENQLRADDLLVRQKAGASLGQASARLEKLALEFQRTCIPAPTRQQPYPSPDLMERLNALRAMRQRVLDQESFLHGMSAPAQDKIWRRLREEGDLLEALLHADVAMLAMAAQAEAEVQKLSAPAWKAPEAGMSLQTILDSWDAAARARQDLMQVQAYR